MTPPKLSSLTPEQIRVMIAEACGWTRECLASNTYWFPPNKSVVDVLGPPNYLSDLNAMSEAEKVLTEQQKHEFEVLLTGFVVDDWIWNERLQEGDLFKIASATATQRAHTFLLATGKAQS